jgi:hypothetical protein
MAIELANDDCRLTALWNVQSANDVNGQSTLDDSIGTLQSPLGI